MIGIMRKSLPRGGAAGPEQAIEEAAGLGFDAILFETFTDLDAALDPVRLCEIRAVANDHRVDLSAGIPWLKSAAA